MVTEEQITAAAIALFGKGAATDPGQKMLAHAALEASEKAAWQPIETAPKDAPIVGWARGCKIFHWNDNRCVNRPRPYWATDGMRSTMDRESQPTHWRPLPDPPTESA